MPAIRAIGQQLYRTARFTLNDRLDARWNKDPLARSPTGTVEEFRELAAHAAAREFPEADEIERDTGFAIDRRWLDDLALHTQIVKKRSELGYPHGRLLYSVLRQYISANRPDFVSIIETGTARGFSALCMAKALADAGVRGHIVTIDRLPHLVPIYWNCIDDLEGRKTRRDLLAPWAQLCDRITFIQGDTLDQLGKIGARRVNFAYLDAQHTEADVLHEFDLIAPLQERGDIVFFDDVTPEQFPGVAAAVETIETRGDYAMQRVRAGRGFAWALRQ